MGIVFVDSKCDCVCVLFTSFLFTFLAVQDSSIGDVVSQSVSESVSHLLISLSSEHCRADNVLVDTSRH